jgi:hypothetical protein
VVTNEIFRQKTLRTLLRRFGTSTVPIHKTFVQLKDAVALRRQSASRHLATRTTATIDRHGARLIERSLSLMIEIFASHVDIYRPRDMSCGKLGRRANINQLNGGIGYNLNKRGISDRLERSCRTSLRLDVRTN